MLPSTLDLTREECRGLLRRLELESYSNVVSTFRAQGGLNDIKKKILEDLRDVFHISQDRHRAEVRRVANDEKLCTIAELISGPNTSQEWCQEGRRTYPLLARSFACTAFSSVANAVAEKLIIENAKIPQISETQQQEQVNSEKEDVIQENVLNIPIVKEDPMIPVLDEKKKIKRPLSQTERTTNQSNTALPSQRKRTINNEKNQHLDDPNQVHTNLRIQQIYHNHSKTVSRHKKSTTKRKTAANKETSFIENTKFVPHKNNSTMNAAMENLPLHDNNKLNVPNPQILHTYASVSQKSSTQNNLRNTETIKSVIQDSLIDVTQSSAQIKNSHLTPVKKDYPSNNVMKVNLPQVKQAIFEEKKNERISNTVHIRQIPEKINSTLNNFCPSTTSISYDNSAKVSVPGSHLQKRTIISEKKVDPTSYLVDNSNPSNNKGFDVNEITSSHPVPFPLRSPSTNSNSSCSSPTVVQIKSLQPFVPVETKKVIRELTVENSNVQQQQQQQQEKSSIVNHSLPMVAKRKIHISNPQIIHPIKISSTSLQCRKGIKIISSSNGQMYIQSATPTDNKIFNSGPSSPKLTKLITTQKNLIIPASSSIKTATSPTIIGNSGNNTITSAIIQNRGLQKIHIIPKTSKQQAIISKSPLGNKIFVHNTSNVANITTNTTSDSSGRMTGTSVPENISEIKNNSIIQNIITEKSTKHHENNVILSQNLFQSTSSISSPSSSSTSTSTSTYSLTPLTTTIVTSATVAKSSAITTTTANNIISLPSPIQQQSSQAQSNVIVIGSIPSNKKESENNNENLYDDNNQSHKNNIITEDTPVYILTAPVTNLDKPSEIDLNCITTNATTTISNIDDNDDDPNFNDKMTKSVQIIHTNEITEEDRNDEEIQEEELHEGIENQEIHHIEYNENLDADDNQNQNESTINKEIIYEVTDWEVELDQEAIRSKEKNNILQQSTKILRGNNNFIEQQSIDNKEIIISEPTTTTTTTNGSNDDNLIYMSDNFHDVIEIEGMESDDGGIIEESHIAYETSYSSQII